MIKVIISIYFVVISFAGIYYYERSTLLGKMFSETIEENAKLRMKANFYEDLYESTYKEYSKKIIDENS